MLDQILRRELLPWYALILILLVVSPYFYLSFYIYPAADDYNYAFLTISKDWNKEYFNQYNTWNGRYASNILVLLNPIAFHNLIFYRFIPLILIFFTFLSVYFFIDSVYRKQFENIVKVNIALTLTLFFLYVMPNIAEGIYWYTGAVTYQISVTLLIIYSALIFRYLTRRYIIGKAFHFILNTIVIILVIGFNEIVMLILLLYHFVLMLFAFFKYEKNKSISVYWFIIVLIASLIIFLAPGNEVRASYFENNHQFFNSVLYSLLQTIRFLSDWISNLPFIIFSLITLYLFKKGNVEFFKVVSYSDILVWGLSIPLIIFICIFPAYWGTGILGQHRTVNVACLLFIMLWLVNLNLWMVYYKELPFFNNIDKILKDKTIIILFLILLITMAVTKNGYNAFTDIYDGKARKYSKEMTERIEKMKGAKSKSIESIGVDPLKYKPATIFVIDITADSDHWINKGYASYYTMKSIWLENNKK